MWPAPATSKHRATAGAMRSSRATSWRLVRGRTRVTGSSSRPPDAARTTSARHRAYSARRRRTPGRFSFGHDLPATKRSVSSFGQRPRMPFRIGRARGRLRVISHRPWRRAGGREGRAALQPTTRDSSAVRLAAGLDSTPGPHDACALGGAGARDHFWRCRTPSGSSHTVTPAGCSGPTMCTSS